VRDTLKTAQIIRKDITLQHTGISAMWTCGGGYAEDICWKLGEERDDATSLKKISLCIEKCDYGLLTGARRIFCRGGKHWR